MYNASNYSVDQQQAIAKLQNKLYGQPDDTLTTDYASGDRVSPELFNLRNNQVDGMLAYLEDSRRDEYARAINAEATLNNRLVGVTFAVTGGRSWIAEPFSGQQLVINPLTPSVVSVLLDQGQGLINGKYVSLPSNPTQIDFAVGVEKDLVVDDTGAFLLKANGYVEEENDLVVGYWNGTTYTARILGQAFLNDVTFTDDVTIQGNLIVSGTTTTLNTNTLDVKDTVVKVNIADGFNVPVPGAITGFAVHRGIDNGTAREMAALVWNEANSRWRFNRILVDDVTEVAGGQQDVELRDLLARNGSLSGTLGVTGAATLSNTLGVTGAVLLSSTLGVTGAATLSNTLGVVGDFTVNTDKFAVQASSGNVDIAGTLDVTGAVSLTSDLAINTNKFVVTAASGNTAIAGNLSVEGSTSLNGSVTVGNANADLFKVQSITLPVDTRRRVVTYDAQGRLATIQEKSTDGATTLKTTTFSYTGADTNISSAVVNAGGVTTTLTFAYTLTNDPVEAGVQSSMLTSVTSAVV